MAKGSQFLLVASMPLILVATVLLVGIAGVMAPAKASPTSCTLAGFAADKVPHGWGGEIEKSAKANALPASVLAAQLEAESGWNPQAMSGAGAQGLAQFIPGTWATFGNGGNVFDPVAAIDAQGRYMKSLMDTLAPVAQASGTEPIKLALAGYNAGPGAVQGAHGIPPISETQTYVQRIMTNAAERFSGPCQPTAPIIGGVDTSGKGDNYPWPQGPVGVANPVTNFYYRECVDFAWMRFMEQAGTPSSPFKYDKNTIGAGDAGTWKAAWERQGWGTGETPKVGAITWYAPGSAGGSVTYGHVGVVKAINPDGTIIEEGYNIDLGSGANHAYYTRTIQAGFPSAYLYIPGKE
jgi:surface antigen